MVTDGEPSWRDDTANRNKSIDMVGVFTWINIENSQVRSSSADLLIVYPLIQNTTVKSGDRKRKIERMHDLVSNWNASSVEWDFAKNVSLAKILRFITDFFRKWTILFETVLPTNFVVVSEWRILQILCSTR